MAVIVLEGFKEFEQKLKTMSAEARGRIAEDAVTEGAGVIEFYAKQNVMRKFSRKQEGKLAESIIPEIQRTETGAVAEIGPRGRIYSRIQELGGTIRPVNAKALHFKINGRDVFVKQVTIPARPYLRPAVEDHTREITEVMKGSILDNLAEYNV